MESAKVVLENFINEMKNYEIEWGNLMQQSVENALSDESNEKRLEQVIEIQNRYLSDKALSLKQDRRITLTFGIPPEYDQRIVNEKNIGKNKIEFDVYRDEEIYRIYTLVFEKNSWKIDKMAIGSMNWKVTRQIF